MRISDWSSDVCSSDLLQVLEGPIERHRGIEAERGSLAFLRIGPIEHARAARKNDDRHPRPFAPDATHQRLRRFQAPVPQFRLRPDPRSEEHTSELQSLMRNSYAVFCLKTNKTDIHPRTSTTLPQQS